MLLRLSPLNHDHLGNTPHNFFHCRDRGMRFISPFRNKGDAELHIKIVEPIGHKATERNAAFRRMAQAWIKRTFNPREDKTALCSCIVTGCDGFRRR